MILSKTKVSAEEVNGEAPVCVRCLYIRYFLMCVLAIALLGLAAGDALQVISELTPMHFAIGVICLLALIAGVKVWLELRAQRPSDEQRS